MGGHTSKDDVGIPGLDLRPATADDAGCLTRIAIRSKAAWGYDAAFMTQCRDELTWDARRLRGLVAVIAEVDGEPVGFYVLGDGEAGVIELDAMFVCPERMRQGVGRALMPDGVRRARSAGATAVTIDSDPNAEGVYLAMGARRVGSAPSGSVPGRALPRLVLDLQVGVRNLETLPSTLEPERSESRGPFARRDSVQRSMLTPHPGPPPRSVGDREPPHGP